MKTQCPHCQTKFKAPDKVTGKKINCPKCNQPFVISPLIKDNKVEVCSNCGKEIGALEQACVISGKIVCAECDKELRRVVEKNLNKATESSKKKDYIPSSSAFGGPVGTIIFVLMIFIGIPLFRTCTSELRYKPSRPREQPMNTTTSQPSLHKAAEQDDTELVKSLLQKGANVNEPDSLGWSPLHFAAYKGNKQTAEVLLNNGAIVNAKANNDVSPLHLAAEQGRTALAELLLGKGADVNARQVQGWTPLGLAAQNGHLETVKLLLDKGADVNSKSKSGLTPLHTAVSKGFREVIELLLSKGAEVNSKSNNGRTPLHTAAYQNQQEAAKLLLSAGADPSVKDIEGKTPIDFATKFGNVTMAKLLAKTTESHPVGEQPKTSGDLPTDGVYSKDIGSGGRYKDTIHGFFEVEPPKGFKIVEDRNRTTTTLDDGTSVPCSRITFQSDNAKIAVITRKFFRGTIEEDLKVVVYNYRSAGAEIRTERFVMIDGTKGAEVGAIAGGYRLLLVKYKKHGMDHAITMSCSPADFPKHQKEFTDFLRSYRSLKSEQDVKH
jgi:ankyrin repeat protein